jgi:hypothetical protein
MSEVRLIPLCYYQLVLLHVIDLYMFRACIWTFDRLEGVADCDMPHTIVIIYKSYFLVQRINPIVSKYRSMSPCD